MGSIERGCPNCRQPMQRRNFAGRGPGPVALDLCMGCQSIWFDAYESSQLTPGAVLELFDLIHRAQSQPPRPLSQSCACPVCHHGLGLTHDIERTNHITYYRCPEGHGRLTTFAQFLLEKNFVRALSPAEVSRLRAVVTRVRCTSCGAPIDIGNDAACPYCRAPIAILDADALQGSVAQLTAAEQARRQPIDRRAAVESLLAIPNEPRTAGTIQDVLAVLFNFS
ncbi:MAG TPA: zf-TFIIB domain-containing protein [Usitatibacter sp.]|nr:zf-TFIIB domain-containing protein [Usitatibacter sp.]